MTAQSDVPPSLLALERDLLLSVGRSLRLHEVVAPFLVAAVQLMALRSAHFYSCEFLLSISGAPTTAEPTTLSAPPDAHDPECEAQARALLASGEHSRSEEANGAFAFCVHLPQTGVIVLSGASPGRSPLLDSTSRAALLSVFVHLGEICALCRSHNLAVQAAQTRSMNGAKSVGRDSDDALTGLPNRRTLQQRLRQAVAAAMRHQHFGAVFFIDIDRFKTINDSMGHAAGDAVLLALSQRLAAAARDEDTLARVGGDEFILVAGNLGSDSAQATRAAQVLASRLAVDCRQPVDIRGATVRMSTSMGICLYPTLDSTDEAALEAASLDAYCENIIRFADTAMYRTKHHGRDGFEFFAPQMQASADRRLILEQQLRLAMERDELSVHYQPIVTSFGAVIGAEALLRWHNIELGSVEPDEFIAVAEDSGLILEIGDWVIEEVCELVRIIAGSPRFPHFRYISVNVSPRQVKQANFVAKIRASIARAPIPPSGLRLELTEHAAIDNIDDTIDKMKQLNALGVLTALDDFGTGYSSLSYLHRLPVSSLKLDRSFVTAIADHEENQAIVDATIAMAGHLGIECVPEGVEAEADLAYFRSRPVHTMQGFYFSAALPAQEFLDVLEAGSLGPMGDLIQQLRIDWPETNS